MQDLVVKILPDIELAWRGDKPLLVLLRVIAGMALSQSYMFVELHAAAAAVVVVVAVDGKDLSLSQHQLLPSNWLRSLFLQFAIFWHITYQRSTSELLGSQHPRLLRSQWMMTHIVRWWWSFGQNSMIGHPLLLLLLVLIAALLLLMMLLLMMVLLMVILILLLLLLLLILLLLLLVLVVLMGGRPPTLHAVHFQQSKHFSCRSESSNKS